MYNRVMFTVSEDDQATFMWAGDWPPPLSLMLLTSEHSPTRSFVRPDAESTITEEFLHSHGLIADRYELMNGSALLEDIGNVVRVGIYELVSCDVVNVHSINGAGHGRAR